MRRKIKKTMVNNPPEVAMLNKTFNGPQFRLGRKPKRREWPVDPDRDRKISEFLAKKAENGKP